MKSLILRSLSGIIYVAVIVFCVLQSGWWLTGLLLVLMLLAVNEFHRLVDPDDTPMLQRQLILIMDWIGGAIVILFLFSSWCVPILLAYIIMRPTAQLFSTDKHPIHSLSMSYMCLLYIAVPLASIGYLNNLFMPGMGKLIILAMFIMIWLNDTGAFVVGSLIGKHRLWPSISPKKSWEGFIGGAAFVIGSAFLFKYCFSSYYGVLPIGNLVLMACVVVIFATWGDLVESRIKRSLGVKDSGNLIPGHGGILDRIDSLLLVAPAVAVLFFLIATWQL